MSASRRPAGSAARRYSGSLQVDAAAPAAHRVSVENSLGAVAESHVIAAQTLFSARAATRRPSAPASLSSRAPRPPRRSRPRPRAPRCRAARRAPPSGRCRRERRGARGRTLGAMQRKTMCALMLRMSSRWRQRCSKHLAVDGQVYARPHYSNTISGALVSPPLHPPNCSDPAHPTPPPTPPSLGP